MSFLFGRGGFVRHLGDVCFRSSAVTLRTPLPARFPALLVSTEAPVPGPRHFSRKPEAMPRIDDNGSSHLSRIVERGGYDDRTNQWVKGSEVKTIDLVLDGRLLSIEWGDGKVSKYHSMWLRYNCYCAQCRHNTSQPKMPFDKVTTQSRVQSAEDDGEGCLIVQWKEDPGHTGILPLKFLKENCYSKESLEEKRNKIRMTFSKDMVIPRVNFEDVMHTQHGLHTWMKALNKTGITIVDDVPCKGGMCTKVMERIADFPQHSIYGALFDVKTYRQPINAAYTAQELKLHMDLIMYEAAPGLQGLHCISFDNRIKGGDSIFVDMFHVAETFREKHPEEFDLLSRVPVPFETIHYKRDWPVHMCYERHMFTVNRHGDLIGVVWHPHLLGPLQVEEELVEPVYSAIGKLYTMVNNFPYQFRHRLMPGEMVVFNNRRVLHGRSAFDRQDEDRHLQGCYVEISEFKSFVHLMSIMEGDGTPPIRVGDFDCK